MPIIKWGRDTQLTTTEWFWKPLIPRGKVTIIEGDGGEGKTTLILTIAAMLSRGKRPPSLINGKLVDEPDIDPVTVFYLTNEDEISDSALVRYYRAGGDGDRFAYSGELEEHVTLQKEAMEDIIRQTNAQLIIVDPYQSFLPEHTHMGSITQMRAVFTMLSNVAKATNCTIVLVGHLTKNTGSKEIHRGFGSADIAASVRSILWVEMDKQDRTFRTVRAIKSNFDESDYSPIRLVFDGNRVLHFAEVEEESESIKDYSEAQPTKIERAMRILQEVLDDGPVPVSEINVLMAEDGIGEKTAQRARQRIGAIQDYENGVAVWRL